MTARLPDFSADFKAQWRQKNRERLGAFGMRSYSLTQCTQYTVAATVWREHCRLITCVMVKQKTLKPTQGFVTNLTGPFQRQYMWLSIHNFWQIVNMGYRRNRMCGEGGRNYKLLEERRNGNSHVWLIYWSILSLIFFLILACCDRCRFVSEEHSLCTLWCEKTTFYNRYPRKEWQNWYQPITLNTPSVFFLFLMKLTDSSYRISGVVISAARESEPSLPTIGKIPGQIETVALEGKQNVQGR